MSKIPDKIFIQQYEDPDIEGFQSGEDVTWSADQINDHDVEYVRKDKYKKALENIKKHLEISLASGVTMSAAWNIANEALKNE